MKLKVSNLLIFEFNEYFESPIWYKKENCLKQLKERSMGMLLDNTERVMNLVDNVDDLKGVDKVRLAIYLLENLNFTTKYDINSFIALLKEVLIELDSNYNKVITNFAKYKNLLLISAKYMELTELEKKKFSVELLFNIFQYDFKNKNINTKINKRLNVYDYCYSLNIM